MLELLVAFSFIRELLVTQSSYFATSSKAVKDFLLYVLVRLLVELLMATLLILLGNFECSFIYYGLKLKLSFNVRTSDKVGE